MPEKKRQDKAMAATPRAPCTIIYVPGLSRDESMTVEVVAGSIATAADRRGGRIATAKSAPAPAGLRAGKTVVEAEERLVDVYELDYRRTFERLDRSANGKEDQAPGLVGSVYYAAWAAVHWLVALKATHRARTKSLAASFQLFLGLLVVVGLAVVALSVALAAAVVVVNRVFDTDWNAFGFWDPADDELLLGGLVVGSGYLAARRALLKAATQARRLLRYYDEPDKAQELHDEVGLAVDALLDEGYQGSIHVLAYSFGCTLVLDALTLGHRINAGHDHRIGSALTSLVTVGCPHDVEKRFLPDRYAGRSAIPTQVEWRNVFIASDLFGSNFGQADDEVESVAAGPGGLAVASLRHHPSDRLTWLSFLRFAAFRSHGDYWHKRGGCWDTVLDLWGLSDQPFVSPQSRAVDAAVADGAVKQ